jgi:hypothetical protein
MTPPLKNGDQVAETMEDKAALFQSVFFPTPPPADLTDIAHTEYPEPLPFPTIEKHEIETAVKAAPADKAPGENHPKQPLAQGNPGTRGYRPYLIYL